MNTTSNALETYTNELAAVEVARNQFNQIPLVKQRAVLAGTTQRLATLEQVENHRTEQFGGAIHNAGMKFLEAIHVDILNNEPQWKKDIREREEEQERITAERDACAKVAAMTASEE